MIRLRTDYIIIHTAAWPGDPSVEDIRRVHTEENGWDDIGYHFVVRKDGTIEDGRKETHIGAHCRASGMNYKSIGICLSGDHDTEKLEGAQRSALYRLLMQLCEKYEIHSDNVLGHREAGSRKSCPGQKIQMQKLRDTVHTLTAPASFIETPEIANKSDNPAANPPDPLPTSDQLEYPIFPDETPEAMKNVNKNETLSDKFIRLLKQKSTQRGIIALTGVAGIAISPDLIEQIVTASAAIWSLVEIVTDDDKK